MRRLIISEGDPDKKVKIPRNASCPCGSGKKYKRCCINSKLQWTVNSEGEYKPIRIIENEHAVSELSDAFDRQMKRFEDIFGRKPTDEDRIFFDQDSYSYDDSFEEIAELMEKLDMDPAIVYAFKKTNMIVTSYNKDSITGQQVEEWNNAIEEYYSIVETVELEESLINKLFSEIETIIVFYGIILSTAGEISDSVENMKNYTSKEYILFCIAKSVKTLKAIRENIQAKLVEDSLNLARSIYENYLNIIYSKNKPNDIEEYLNFNLGIKKGTHKFIKGGFIKEINGDKQIKVFSKYEMANSSQHREDEIIHKHIYGFLSGYTHPDISTIKNYSRDNKLTATTSPSNDVAILLTVYYGLLILSEVMFLDSINNTKKNDINRVIIRIAKLLVDYLNTSSTFIEEGSFKQNLINRLNNIKRYANFA